MSVRSLVLVAASCSVFGGCIGAAATAATQSQADPRAIAAAIQQVRDTRTESSLRGINDHLRQMERALSGETHLLESICKNTKPRGVDGILLCSQYGG